MRLFSILALLLSLFAVDSFAQTCTFVFNPLTGKLECGGSTSEGGSGPSYTPDTSILIDGVNIGVNPATVPFKATDNIYAGKASFTPTSTQSIAAGSTIQCTGVNNQVSPTSTFVTMTSTPTVAAGVNGQWCLLQNVSGTNALILQSTSVLGGSNLTLNTPTVYIPPKSNILLVYNTAVGWSQVMLQQLSDQLSAEAGLDSTMLMSPLRVAQAIAAQCAVNSVSGHPGEWFKTNGTTTFWTPYFVGTPASQTISSAGTAISISRFYHNLNPSANHVSTAAPTIADGEDGQFVAITNVSSTYSYTLPDETNLPSSNLLLGGTNIVLAPKQSVLLVFNATLGGWLPFSSSGGGGGATWERTFTSARCQYGTAGAGFNVGSTNYPEPECVEGTNFTYGVLSWDDSGTKPVYDFVTLPATVGTVKVDVGWSTSVTAGTGTFKIQTACVSGTPDPTPSTAQSITGTASGTANNMTVSTLTSLTVSGCSGGQQMKFKFYRDVADSITAALKLHYIRIYQ